MAIVTLLDLLFGLDVAHDPVDLLLVVFDRLLRLLIIYDQLTVYFIPLRPLSGQLRTDRRSK